MQLNDVHVFVNVLMCVHPLVFVLVVMHVKVRFCQLFWHLRLIVV